MPELPTPSPLPPTRSVKAIPLNKFKKPKTSRDPNRVKKQVTSRKGQVESFAPYLYVGSLPLWALFLPLSRLLERRPELEEYLQEHLAAMDRVSMPRTQSRADLEAVCVQAQHSSILAAIMQVWRPAHGPRTLKLPHHQPKGPFWTAITVQPPFLYWSKDHKTSPFFHPLLGPPCVSYVWSYHPMQC